MTYERHGVALPNPAPCFYPNVDLAFRGPERSLEGPYVTFLGGTLFHGKYAVTAIPDRVEQVIGRPCVNLGLMNAGVGVMSLPPLVDLANRGAATVIEIVAAQNTTNRFYKVHPRRNDRLVSVTRLFRKVFPDLDLSEVHFTRHLLRLMRQSAPNRFETVVEELRAAWVEGMLGLLSAVEGPKILVWAVPQPATIAGQGFVEEPYLIDRAVVHAISDRADALVEVRETDEMRARGYAGMHVPDTQSRILSALPRASLLDATAEALLEPLARSGIGPAGRDTLPMARGLSG